MPLAGFCSRCLSATAVDRAAGSRAWTSFFVLGASCRVLNHAATSGRVRARTSLQPSRSSGTDTLAIDRGEEKMTSPVQRLKIRVASGAKARPLCWR